MEEINKIEDNRINREVIKKYFPVAILFFIVYILVAFFIQKDHIGGFILTATLIFAFLAMLIFMKTNNLMVATNMLAFLGIPVLIPWLINGGPGGVGFWWSVVYVVWAFFVADKKVALFWLSVHLILSISIFILSENDVLKIAYSISELVNLLFAFIIVIVLVYLFARVREYYYQLSFQQAKELKEMNRILVSSNDELKQFVYISTHFLQEPLRTISNFAGLIEEKYAGKTDKDTDEYLTYILNSTEKMKELIKDLMNFTRIEKDRKYVSVDCNLILKEVISDMQTEIKNSGAIITVSHLPIVTGDYKMLKQLFANLIENSIKFRKKNVAPQIRISAEEKENEFLFKVEDNGIGIDEQHIKKLFNIFQRLHNADEYPGTGIGLATAKKIVNLHNGRIWIESKLGEGCKMHFTIHKEQLKIIT